MRKCILLLLMLTDVCVCVCAPKCRCCKHVLVGTTCCVSDLTCVCVCVYVCICVAQDEAAAVPAATAAASADGCDWAAVPQFSAAEWAALAQCLPMWQLPATDDWKQAYLDASYGALACTRATLTKVCTWAGMCFGMCVCAQTRTHRHAHTPNQSACMALQVSQSTGGEQPCVCLSVCVCVCVCVSTGPRQLPAPRHTPNSLCPRQ